MFGGGIATALMAGELIVKWIGGLTVFASFASWLLTQHDIDKLKESNKTTVHYKECDDFLDFDDVEKIFNNKETAPGTNASKQPLEPSV